MKYRFLRDFPPTDFRKGDTVNKDDCGWSKSRQALLLATGIIEEVTPPEWPTRGDIYYYVSSKGEVCDEEWKDGGRQNQRKSFGNCFRTQVEGEAVREKIKKLIKEGK